MSVPHDCDDTRVGFRDSGARAATHESATIRTSSLRLENDRIYSPQKRSSAGASPRARSRRTKRDTIVICRKIHFLHRRRTLGHRYDGVLRRLADHRSNVRTNSSDYPALLRMNPPAPSSLPALQVLPGSRCPAHELMDVY